MDWQEDWGQEFGGDNPDKLQELDEEIYRPYGEAPKGRKQDQGWVERSHRTDDEELYIPHLGQVRTVEEFLALGQWWQFYYNVQRPHFGVGMGGLSPIQKLRPGAPRRDT